MFTRPKAIEPFQIDFIANRYSKQQSFSSTNNGLTLPKVLEGNALEIFVYNILCFSFKDHTMGRHDPDCSLYEMDVRGGV